VRIVLASHNTAKLTQLQELFAPLGAQLMLLPQLSAVVPEETGATFVENALLKARHAAALTGMAALADDSGICVDALAGAPGCIPHVSPVPAQAMPTTTGCCCNACVVSKRHGAARRSIACWCFCAALQTRRPSSQRVSAGRGARCAAR